MQKQTRFEVVNKAINQKKGKLNLHELQVRFCSRLTSKIIRKYEFTNNKFLKKYRSIERKYFFEEIGIKKEFASNYRMGGMKTKENCLFGLVLSFVTISSSIMINLYIIPLIQTIKHWELFSFLFFNKNILLLKFETKQIQRNPHRVSWQEEEQTILIDAFKYLFVRNRDGKRTQWNSISKRIFFETEGNYYKNSKQCRQHWFNHLDKSIKKGDWNKNEDLLLLKSVQIQGRKWSIISRALNERRTQHSIKNRFHSLMKINNKKDGPQISQEQRLNILIAQLQGEAKSVASEREQMASQSSQIVEQQIESQKQSESAQSQHFGLNQLSPNNDQIFPINQPIAHQWNSIPAIQSPYYFVFSPFSFSSTASPYVNSSWSNWQSNAHQTLFFNPVNVQQMPSFSNFEAMAKNDQNHL